MTTLAVLQNQWGHSAGDPDYPNRLARLESLTPEAYARHVRICLEWSNCRTYQRLIRLFGETSFDQIFWTNASRNAGATSSARFDASAQHLDATIRHFRPDVVLTFGKVATEGVRAWATTQGGSALPFDHLATCHPVARHSGAGDELRRAVELWKQMVKPC